MKVKRIHDEPSLNDNWDCVWVGLSKSREPRPFNARVLHLIDWGLGGNLSRYLLSAEEALVFVPTMGRLPFALLCVDRMPFRDLGQIAEQATKNRWSKMLFIVEDREAFSVVEKCFEKSSGNTQVLVFDGV